MAESEQFDDDIFIESPTNKNRRFFSSMKYNQESSCKNVLRSLLICFIFIR
jgi:hypothetical protein